MKRIMFIFAMIMLALTSFGCSHSNGDIKNPGTIASVSPGVAEVGANVDVDTNANVNVDDNTNANAKVDASADDAAAVDANVSANANADAIAMVENNAKLTTISSSSTSSGTSSKLVKKTVKIPYLVSNDIGIDYIDETLESPKGIVRYSSIKISGLSNLSIQKQLNSSIQKSVENAVKVYAMEADEVNEFYCMVEFSFNNLLSISLHDTTRTLCNGFLYRLTDGKRLLLKDIFTTGTDYVTLINSQIPLAILGSDVSEEDILREPFTTIDSNQDFYLTKEKLYAIFKKNQSGFAKQIGIGIPRSKIDAYMDIIDEAGFSQQKTAKKNSKRVVYNNIFITETGKVIKTSAGNISVHYPVISGLQDYTFEKKINASVQLAITKMLNSKKLKSAGNVNEDAIFAIINSEVALNHFGLICITTYAGGYQTSIDLRDEQTSLCFDLKKKKQIHLSDIFRNYAKKQKSFAPAFTALVKQNIASQYNNSNADFVKKTNKKITFDFILRNSTIHIGFEDFQIAIDFYMNIVFKDGAIVPNDYGQRIEFWCSIANLPKTSTEEFFGWE